MITREYRTLLTATKIQHVLGLSHHHHHQYWTSYPQISVYHIPPLDRCHSTCRWFLTLWLIGVLNPLIHSMWVLWQRYGTKEGRDTTHMVIIQNIIVIRDNEKIRQATKANNSAAVSPSFSTAFVTSSVCSAPAVCLFTWFCKIRRKYVSFFKTSNVPSRTTRSNFWDVNIYCSVGGAGECRRKLLHVR